jgi:hypothetical protein
MVRLPSFVACLFGAGLAFAQTVECPGGPPGWIQAEGTGCKLWNLCPRHRQTVTWSGACVNGFGEGFGVQQWFVEGKPADREEGNMRTGKLNGFGVSTLPNGDRYEGEFRDGKRTGRGVYTWASRDGRNSRDAARGTDNPAIWYEGEFVDGEFHGNGVMLFCERRLVQRRMA